MNPVTAAIEVARQATLQLVRHRMMVVVLGLALVAMVLFAFLMPLRWAREHTGDELYGLVAYVAWIQFGLPFVALFFGVTVVHQDLEDRTATYLFLRPIRRVPLLLGKWLAASVVSALVIAVIVVVTWLAIAVPTRPWRAGLPPGASSCWVIALGAVLAAPAYTAVGAFAGATFKRPLVLAMAFFVGWEVVVSNLPGQSGVRGLTIAEPLRRWLCERLPAAFEVVRGMRLPTGAGLQVAGPDPLFALARAAVLPLAAALWIYSRREYDSRPRD